MVKHYAYAMIATLFVALPGFAENTIPELPVFERNGLALDYRNLKYNPCDDLIFPSIINAEKHFDKPLGKYYMYYAPHNRPGGICLAFADSLAGPWQEYKSNPVITRRWRPHYTVSHVSSPHALWIQEEKQLFIWFHGENNTTRYASSKDGISFSYQGVAVSTKNYSNISECSYARVFRHPIHGKDCNYVLMFMGNNKGTRRIYLAWSKDARTWETKKSPFISPPPGSHGQIGAPWLFPWKGKLYVIYHTRFHRLSNAYSLFATEIDAAFDKTRHAGDFFTALKGSPDYGRVASPCFVKSSDKLYMFYQSGKRLHSKIAVAVAGLEKPE